MLFLSLITVTMLNETININIGALIYYVTVIEFIVAQGLHKMQGLLITLWYMFMWTYLASQSMSPSSIGCHWEYYAVKTGLVLIWSSVTLLLLITTSTENLIDYLMLMRDLSLQNMNQGN